MKRLLGTTWMGVGRWIRRAIEAACIPYTYVFALPTLTQPNITITITILGADGNIKATLHIYILYRFQIISNKIVYIKIMPHKSQQHIFIVGLWEKKIAKTLHKINLSEQQANRQQT